jgi:hypothetical protein
VLVSDHRVKDDLLVNVIGLSLDNIINDESKLGFEKDLIDIN